MIRCQTANVEETRAVAAAVAEVAESGDLIALVGGLGAGKTAFTQGFAVALGITDRVTSPTFALATRYEGRLVLNHLDVYRIADASESRDLGIDELLEDGVTLIEWADAIMAVLPQDRLDVVIGFCDDGDDQRTLELVPVGQRWSERLETLAVGRPAADDLKDEMC